MAVTQEGEGRWVYNLTEHSFTVTGADGVVFKAWRLPDTPGGFTLTGPERRIEVHNSNGVEFVDGPDEVDDEV